MAATGPCGKVPEFQAKLLYNNNFIFASICKHSVKGNFSQNGKNSKMSTCRKTHAWQCCADVKFVCPHCVQPNAWRNFLRKNITEKRRRVAIFLWKSFEKTKRSPCRPSAWAKAQKGEECRNLQNFISFYWFLPPLLHLSTQLCTFCLQNTVFCAIKKYKIR